MSQHDMNVDNADGLTVRTDFNAAVQALVTCSSGAVEPAAPFPGMLWLDLSVAPDGVLRQRNQGNTAWLPVLLPPEFRFIDADLFFGGKQSPNRFVWNDKVDGTGLDIMTLREDGHLSLAGAGASPVAAGDVPTKGYVDSLAVPVGGLMHFAMQTPPVNWLKANGASLLRDSYPALFSAISTTYGAADSSHFTLPDLRGEFLRGFDDGRGVDAGRGFGSWQGDQFASHTHSELVAGSHAHGDASASFPVFIVAAGTSALRQVAPGTGALGFLLNTIGYSTTTSTDPGHVHTILASGGSDTRPRNISQLACIKYQ